MSKRIKSEGSWLSAGQVDSVFAALGGFLAGVSAVRNLAPSALGAYALLFSGFSLASQFPTQMVLSPAEVLVASSPVSERPSVLRLTIPRGAVAALAGGVGVVLLGIPFRHSTDASTFWILTFTCALYTVFSPLQDHVRRLAHLARRSWLAAVLSVAYFLSTGAALWLILRVNPTAAAFGAMAIGNLASLLIGIALLKPRRREDIQVPSARSLRDVGKWLLLTGIMTGIGNYAVAALVTGLAGATVLGAYESARVASRPAGVVAAGLIQPIGPRLTAAAASGSYSEMARLRRVYYLLLAGAAVVFLIGTGPVYPLNPIFRLVPEAYSQRWLLLAVMTSTILFYIPAPYMSELLGRRQERRVGTAETVAQVVRVAVSLLAPWVGAMILPISLTAGTVVKAVLYRSADRTSRLATKGVP